MGATKVPNTLQEIILYFADPQRCREYLIARHWPDGVTCPQCGSKKVKFQEKYNRWQCASDHSRRQFTLKTGTIFEDSPIGLDRWLAAMWQVVNCKNGTSSYEVHRTLGVTQKTAWFMYHRIRFALGMQRADKLTGEVQADEPFIGVKARNIHVSKHERGGDRFVAPVRQILGKQIAFNQLIGKAGSGAWSN